VRQTPTVDRLLEQGRQEVDPIKRRRVYVELERSLMDQADVAPLFDGLNVFALRPEVHGLKFAGVGYPVVTNLLLQS
jgi:ABC-type transport system substrate-binding protein